MMRRAGTFLLVAWLPAAAVWAEEAPSAPAAASSAAVAASAADDTEADEPTVNARDPYESLNRKVFEFNDPDVEALQERIAKKLGYKLVDHRLELYAVPIDDKARR